MDSRDPTGLAAEQRPTHQRSGYVADGPSERYIVPLLADRIPALFAAWGQRRSEGGHRALDAGCGLQPFRGLLEEGGYEYCSSDAVQNRAGTVQFIGPLDGELPAGLAAAGGFDFILCTEVLEHVADWRGAFVNFATLLRPGGRLLLTVPHFYPLHEIPYDYWRPTPYAIEEFARRFHFKVCHVEKAGGPWEVLGTFLSESRFDPQHPGIAARLITIGAKAVRKVVEQAIDARWVRKYVHFRSPYFLSCLAVLERESPGPAAPRP